MSLPACQARYEWAVTWIQADSEHWLCWIRIQTESLHMSLQLLFVQHFVFYNVNQISLGFTPVRRKKINGDQLQIRNISKFPLTSGLTPSED